LKDVHLSVIIATFALMLLWISLSGYFNALQLGLGFVSSVAVIWLTIRLKLLTFDGVRLALLPRYPLYLLWLIRQIIWSNLLVARIVLSPRMPLHRQIVLTKPKQHSDMATTIYANSITLTPGTVTVDSSEDGLLVHSLAKVFADGVLANEMNNRIAGLETNIPKDEQA
tara:strand:- start:1316 stop:1822 length:507 start_codon:yes stop_codon:yes gene_type:complete